jgi:hypothetical protein
MFGEPFGEPGAISVGALHVRHGGQSLINDSLGRFQVRRGPSPVGGSTHADDQGGRRPGVKPVERDLAVPCAPKTGRNHSPGDRRRDAWTRERKLLIC